MAKPMNLTLRQMLEGMTLTFDAAAVGDMDATLQFNVTGADSRPITNVDRALAQMRAWAIVGLVVAVGMVFTIWFAL